MVIFSRIHLNYSEKLNIFNILPYYKCQKKYIDLFISKLFFLLTFNILKKDIFIPRTNPSKKALDTMLCNMTCKNLRMKGLVEDKLIFKKQKPGRQSWPLEWSISRHWWAKAWSVEKRAASLCVQFSMGLHF